MALTEEYFNEIEYHFGKRRGTFKLFNAKERLLITEWAEQGIPLPVVIEALDEVFDKAVERETFVSGLSYCRHAVKRLWKDRKELQIGASATVPEEGASETLVRLADAVAPVSSDIADEIRALQKEQSARTIEDRLIEIERRLIAQVPDLDAIRAEVTHELAGKVDEKNRARTEEAMVLRIVREKYALPRLSLFG